MELTEARFIAEGIINKLVPVTMRAMICGSVRRHKREVRDIDIVCQANKIQVKDIFDNPLGDVVSQDFIKVVNTWEKVKGEPTGKYTVRLLPSGHHLELTMANEATWIPLIIIRTGDQDFTHMLMIRAKRLGFEQRDGQLWDGDQVVPMREEADYFRVLNLPFIVPEKRDKYAFK